MVTLKKGKEFEFIYKRGAKKHGYFLILFFYRGSNKKVGFTVSKKVGDAVIRNRVRRQLREIYRFYDSNIDDGQVVIVAKSSIVGSHFSDIQREFYMLGMRLGFLHQ